MDRNVSDQRNSLTVARVNAKYLSEHKGQTVRLTAKVVNLVGESATVEASDGGEVGIASSKLTIGCDPSISRWSAEEGADNRICMSRRALSLRLSGLSRMISQFGH